MKEEGSACDSCDTGTFQFIREGDCSCHISPPCHNCLDAPLKCDKCGERAEDQE